MVKKLSSDPAKRRLQVFKRLYNIYYEWGSLIESGEMDYFVITIDGEEVYRVDLLVGFDDLPENQKRAFQLICLESMTELQAQEVITRELGSPTPVQQHAEAALKRMLKAYDEQQDGGYTSPQAKKRLQEIEKRKSESLRNSVKTVEIESDKTPRLGSRQKVVLEELATHHTYFKKCGWKFNSHSETVEVLDSLVSRGIVVSSLTTEGLRYSLP